MKMPQWFVAVVYPESFNISVFESYCRQQAYYYAYILHDKDTDKDGNLKKAHYHIFVDLMSNQVTDKVLEKLGIGFSQWQRCRDPYSYLKYMIHEE